MSNNSVDLVTLFSNSIQNISFESLTKLDSFKSLVKAIESGFDVKKYPILPLYQIIHDLGTDEKSLILPILSKKQRQSLFDLDLWDGDQFQINHFYSWLQSFYQIRNHDELKVEFIQSPEFLLFLKLHFTISTFDLDDPQYPEHENFFITDDQLLLFEFPEGFNLVDELINLIRLYYSHYGVELAYANLFKMVSDSHILFEETEYQIREKRLGEEGLITSFRALEILSPFHTFTQLDSFIKRKLQSPIKNSSTLFVSGIADDYEDEDEDEDDLIESCYINNKIPPFQLILGSSIPESERQELSKIEDKITKDRKIIGFFDLVNAFTTNRKLFKKDKQLIQQNLEELHHRCDIGLKYLKQNFSIPNSVFHFFDFKDLYKIGSSILQIPQKRIIKTLSSYNFTNIEKRAFLGDYLLNFLDESLENWPKFQGFPIKEVEDWEKWNSFLAFFCELTPYIRKIEETYTNLKEEQAINDLYYLNYTLETVTFENIIISLFINYDLYQKPFEKKIGVKIEDFLSFIDKFYIRESDNNSVIKNYDNLRYSLTEFSKNFGFYEFKSNSFPYYLYQILDSYLSNVNYVDLEEIEFEHIGGAIILTDPYLKNDDQKDFLYF